MTKLRDANDIHRRFGSDALRDTFDRTPVDDPLPDDSSDADHPPRRRPFHPTICTARELHAMRFQPIRYVVDGYIAEGCTLLAGRPKLGKSWLMLEVGLAVAAGISCLGGRTCEQGAVLYLALEDNQRRLQKRIGKVLGTFGVEWPSAFHYATEWARANECGLDAIRDWIETTKNPRLVIVDVLAMFKPVRGGKETLYEADYHAIKGLQALASTYNIAIVVVHHTRKGLGETDPFEKVSGTLGLSGAADTTIILDRDGSGATLYGRGRDIEESRPPFHSTGTRAGGRS
jgi:RecA-family ATPase